MQPIKNKVAHIALKKMANNKLTISSHLAKKFIRHISKKR